MSEASYRVNNGRGDLA